ncbi:unnamed protein product [Paramecium sonneborni]|uniref:Uncharacterized protein n=1 Tax=Paramecium sonneborni TaxID=65129 RepID=A0A8S1PA17_9CILI|nr:unnamed protein product [Paramecium sonneborni]
MGAIFYFIGQKFIGPIQQSQILKKIFKLKLIKLIYIMNRQSIRMFKPLRGRPRKSAQKDYFCQNEEEYIADDSQCVKLIFLLANLASYKIKIKTGPKQLIDKNEEKQKCEIQKDINQAFEDFQIFKKEYFFLSNQKKNYQFENNILVDKTVYKCIKKSQFNPQLHNLIAKLNIVFKLLDSEFIEVLENIFQIYSTQFDMEADQVSTVDHIIQQIRNPNNFEKFQYLLLWETLRNISKEIRIDRIEAELNKQRLKISEKTSKKVIQKQKQFIQIQENQIMEEKFMDPITYLITKLVQIFDDIVFNNYNSEENY